MLGFRRDGTRPYSPCGLPTYWRLLGDRREDGACHSQRRQIDSPTASGSAVPAQTAVEDILEHYGLRCPIGTGTKIEEAEGLMLSEVLRDVLNNILKPDFRVRFKDQRWQIRNLGNSRLANGRRRTGLEAADEYSGGRLRGRT
jgi:hypothetical protein